MSRRREADRSLDRTDRRNQDDHHRDRGRYEVGERDRDRSGSRRRGDDGERGDWSGRRRRRSESRSDDDSVKSDESRGSKKRSRKSKKQKKSKSKKRDTSADRALRKLEKEQLKKELEAQKEAQVAAQMAASLGYTNKDNPFNDGNLSQKFVWIKKREQEMKKGITAAERSRRDAEKRQEVQEELAKLSRLRTEREIEMELREQEQTRLRREQDRAALGDWEKREDEFHLGQAKTRAIIRIKEGRAKPIDILAMNISMATDNETASAFEGMGLEMDTEEPYLIFQNLTLSEVVELHKDIQLYLAMEQNDGNKSFWTSMLIVCDDELNRHRKMAADGGKKDRNAAAEVVEVEITKMLSGKSYEQLAQIQTQVERKLSGQDNFKGPIDVEYWEAVMKALVVWRAKARLRDMHKFLLSKRLEQLKAKASSKGSGDLSEVEKPVVRLGRSLLPSSSTSAASAEKAAQALRELEETADFDADDAGMRAVQETVEGYDGSMSPKLTDEIPLEDTAVDVVDEEYDYEELLSHRRRILKGVSGNIAEAEKPDPVVFDEGTTNDNNGDDFEENEEAFNEEANIVNKTAYLWQDKYRPRKPRYFNRVHTGFEWNKYNQTHYDSDNPPPKVVQGYKFNIFYPDLIDKSKAPTYKIERDDGFPDTVILRFKASAPYEDVAFRIVNREWEYSHKKGFRSAFDRGILQLHFHFKRHYYRR
ncbi:mid region of cactin-domain-containing protein [Zopfochytrium polystomum]|nr:mid region of cactin-domain-containing protein [Zopfochytrium polystomum]